MATWVCAASRDLDIYESSSWDGPEAKDKIFTWAGWPDNPDSDKAKKAFLAYDSSEPSLKGSYKLPFCNIVDGSLKADSSGINAASSRLPQTDIPDSVSSEADSVLQHYKDRIHNGRRVEIIGRDAPKEVFATTARVARSTLLPVDDLKTRLASIGMDSDIFKENELFFWGADISNRSIDTYFTSMDVSSLKNYATDADLQSGFGVAFQNSHNTRELNFGRTIYGNFTGGSNSRTAVDAYTIKNFNPAGVNTDEIIKGMRSGILKDVSIGFYGGWFRCSICNCDMFDWSMGWEDMCPHIPGVEYDIKNKSGDVVDRQTAIAYVMDAHLSEVSIVYDGACEGAAIRKARIEAEGHRIKPEIADLMEARYRINLPGSHRSIKGVSLPKGNERMPVDLIEVAPKKDEAEIVAESTPDPMDESRDNQNDNVNPNTADSGLITTHDVAPEGDRSRDLLSPVKPDGNMEFLRASLVEAGINPKDDPKETLRLLVDEVRKNRELAKDGETYRKDLIQEAIDAGIQAQGDNFNPDTYRALLSGTSIESIKTVRDGFREQAKGIIPAKRQTEDPNPNIIIDELATKRESKTQRPVSVFNRG